MIFSSSNQTFYTSATSSGWLPHILRVNGDEDRQLSLLVPLMTPTVLGTHLMHHQELAEDLPFRRTTSTTNY